MKRIIELTVGLFLIISMMLCIMPVAFASTTFVTATSAVHVRSEPSTDASIIRSLNSGTALEMLEHDPAGWSKVRVFGDTGYIRSDLITLRGGTGTLRTTTDGVRVRSSASTEARILTTLNQGTQVQVNSHNPTGWSNVTVNGVTGYIRSDFLTGSTNFVAGVTSGSSTSSGSAASSSEPVTLMTLTGVNVRSGPSTSNSVVTSLTAGTNVNVTEHNPSGWSKIKLSNGSTGYIKSEYLAAPGTPLNSSDPQTLYTTTGVNVRSGPSTDHSVLRQLQAGTRVQVTNQSNGWSQLSDGGYIRSDLLSANLNSYPLELVTIETIRGITRSGSTVQVYDIRTGITYNLRILAVGGHLDVEPPTYTDAEAHLRTFGGARAWAPRPVKVTIGGRTFAAAMTGMPHSVSTVQGNGVNGHFCLHFNETITINKSYQADLRVAVAQAWASR